MIKRDIIFNSKLIILSISFIILMLIILPIGLTFAIKLIPGGIQPPLVNTKKIYGQYVYYQSFISPDDNLTGVGTSIKNPNFANKKELIINLYDEKNTLIRTIVLNGQNLADGNFVKILFEPVLNSKNKKFTWSALSYESTFDDALELFLTDKQPAWSLEFRVNNAISEGGVSYVTLHKPLNSTEVLNKIINGLVSRIKADRGFFLVYSILILGLIGALYFPNLHQFIKKNRP